MIFQLDFYWRFKREVPDDFIGRVILQRAVEDPVFRMNQTEVHVNIPVVSGGNHHGIQFAEMGYSLPVNRLQLTVPDQERLSVRICEFDRVDFFQEPGRQFERISEMVDMPCRAVAGNFPRRISVEYDLRRLFLLEKTFREIGIEVEFQAFCLGRKSVADALFRLSGILYSTGIFIDDFRDGFPSDLFVTYADFPVVHCDPAVRRAGLGKSGIAAKRRRWIQWG